MREIDRVAIEEVGPNLYQMMENAGRNLALTVIEQLGDDWSSVPIVVLAGTGGNGGGGICAARHLANRGADVTVVVSDPERLAPVPGEQLAVYGGTPGRQGGVGDLPDLEAAVIVDAVIGYSLGGAPRGVAETMIEWATGHSAPVISLDVPSGVDSTTGDAPGAHVQAAMTMTLALPKTGLDAIAVRELWLADIGIPAEVYRRVGVDVSAETFGDRYRVGLRPQDP
jgi:NAD(P)H-hydrate epimerase